MRFGIQQFLVCPYDRERLSLNGSWLTCQRGHVYPVVDGIPILLRDDGDQTIGIAKESLEMGRRFAAGDLLDDPLFISTLGISTAERQELLKETDRGNSRIDAIVQYLIGATNGLMYKHLVGNLPEYPIPELRLPPSAGARFLDIGCNWGRWSIAAAKLGYRPVGIDPSLGAVLAARRVCQQLELEADFIVADARFLPFGDNSFEWVFSYSVLQHFTKGDARHSFQEIGRVINDSGRALIQMPNKMGLRCLYHQVKRRFKEPERFEVRYWSLAEMQNGVRETIAPAIFSVDCFFAIGLQAADCRLMPRRYRLLIRISEWLRRLSLHLPSLILLADSVYIDCVKPQNGARE